MGEILSALADLIGSLANSDPARRRHPVVVAGVFLAAPVAVGIAAAWVLG